MKEREQPARWPMANDSDRHAAHTPGQPLQLVAGELDFYLLCDGLWPEDWICLMFGVPPDYGVEWAQRAGAASDFSARLNQALALLKASPPSTGDRGWIGVAPMLRWVEAKLSDDVKRMFDGATIAALQACVRSVRAQGRPGDSEEKISPRSKNLEAAVTALMILHYDAKKHTSLNKLTDDLSSRIDGLMHQSKSPRMSADTLEGYYKAGLVRLAEGHSPADLPTAWEIPTSFLKIPKQRP